MTNGEARDCEAWSANLGDDDVDQFTRSVAREHALTV
jgi:hypothetical protein